MAEIEHKGVFRLEGNHSHQQRGHTSKRNRNQIGRPALCRSTSLGRRNEDNLQNRKSRRTFSQNRAKTDDSYSNVRTPGILDFNIKQDRSVLHLKGGGEIQKNKTVGEIKAGETTRSNIHGESKSLKGEGKLENFEKLDPRISTRQNEHNQKNANNPTVSLLGSDKKTKNYDDEIKFKDVKIAKNETEVKVTLSNPFMKSTKVSQLPNLPKDSHIWEEHDKEYFSMSSSSDMEFDNEHCLQPKDIAHDKIIIGTEICTNTHVLNDKKSVHYNTVQHSLNQNLINSPKERSNDITNKKNVCTTTFAKRSIKSSHKIAGGDAVFRYRLSDRSFIDKGITVLPVVNVIRKTNVYRMIPVNLEFDWLKNIKEGEVMKYNSGEKLAEFDANGRGRWYYKNGGLALDYYNAEGINAQQRIVIYSSGQPDEKGRSHPISILAVFDYLGNGIVFDHVGKIRLKYNQSEGVVLDRSIGPVSKWMWHSCIDQPVLRQVMMDTNLVDKDPEIIDIQDTFEPQKRKPLIDEQMLAIEIENTAKKQLLDKSHSYQTYQIKMKVLKINKYFSLRIQDQTKIYILFRDGVNHLKLNIGMVLDHNEILDFDTCPNEEVDTNFEKHPARSTSLEELQDHLKLTKEMERARVNHELRLRPAVPVASIDRLTASTSRRRRPVHEIAFNTTLYNPYQNRKPTRNSLYYDTRIS